MQSQSHEDILGEEESDDCAIGCVEVVRVESEGAIRVDVDLRSNHVGL